MVQQSGDAGGGGGGLLNPMPEASMGATPAAPTAAAPTAPAAPPSFFDKHLGQAQARFDAMKKETHRIGAVRKGLDSLREKGDAVTEDDVLDEMADLVAHGADPKMFAAMMAGSAGHGVPPMPPGGDGLATWLEQVSETLVAPYEAQLKPAMALAQHQLGVAALHRMVDLHAKAAKSAGPPPPESPVLGGPAPPAMPAPNAAAPSLLQ